MQDYRNYAFKMGKTALGTLQDDLGRRTTRVVRYENAAILDSSSAIAIDGHALRSCSDENDLGEAVYKYNALKEDQVNLLMGYDINTGMPLLSRIYCGSCNDKATITDLAELFGFTSILFVIDRGFYSAANLKLLSDKDNMYIIPLSFNDNVFRKAMGNVQYTDSFYYRFGEKHVCIEYTCHKISDLESVYVFRDIDENEKRQFIYQHCISLGKSGYTQERFEQVKDIFGVYVLQSNAAMSAEDIFSSYKKRWGIETLYQYIWRMSPISTT